MNGADRNGSAPMGQRLFRFLGRAPRCAPTTEQKRKPTCNRTDTQLGYPAAWALKNREANSMNAMFRHPTANPHKNAVSRWRRAIQKPPISAVTAEARSERGWISRVGSGV